MKTILSINGESYLIPKTTDPAKVLELLSGARKLRSEAHYGSEEHKYEEEHGYFDRKVAAEHPAKMSVELVLDDEVCTRQEFEALCAAADTREAQRGKTVLPQAA